MLNFSHFSFLDTHLNFLHKTIPSSQAHFLVGGCVRDLVLWLEKHPSDIDFTMAGNPGDLYTSIDTTNLSHFMTEKFGTITLIKDQIQYELTPLRTEGGYTDSRHPEEITWSNDLLLDSQRRDFTINCLYYFSLSATQHKHLLPSVIPPASQKKTLEHILETQGMAYIPEEQLFILQHHGHIAQLFAGGKFQEEYCAYLVNVISEHMIFSTETPPKKSPGVIRFLIDPHHGIQDLINRQLRAVGDPDKRFQEDALRLLRALRFVNVLNQKLISTHHTQLFDFHKATWQSLKQHTYLLQNIAKERIKDELIKIFSQGNPFGFIALIDEVGLLSFLFPALFATKYIDQPVRFHPFDVYTHTILTLFELQKINKNYLVRLGMLYHDVGKPAQFAAYGDQLNKEQIREILAGPLNHRRGGLELTKRDFTALWFSGKEVEAIVRYVEHHHKIEEILDGESNDRSKKKLRKFLSEAWLERVHDILDITMADRLGQYNPLQNSSDLTEVQGVRTLLKQIHDEEGQFIPKDMVINGNDIMKHFAIPGSALVGELLTQGFDRVLWDIKTRNNKKSLYIYLEGYLKNKK